MNDKYILASYYTSEIIIIINKINYYKLILKQTSKKDYDIIIYVANRNLYIKLIFEKIIIN